MAQGWFRRPFRPQVAPMDPAKIVPEGKIIPCMWEHHPQQFMCVVLSSQSFFIATLIVNCRHIAAVRRRPLTMQRRCYVSIIMLPSIFAVTANICLLIPRTLDFSQFLQTCYQAHAVGTFGVLLFSLLSHSAASIPVEEPCMADGSVGPVEKIVSALAAQGPRKHFAVPPIGCCLAPCLPRHNLTPFQLLLLFRCIRQFTIVTVSAAIVSMEVVAAEPPHDFGDIVETVQFVTVKLSTVVAVSSLFVLMNTSKPLLGHLNTKFKFVAIKCTILFELLRNAIIQTVFNYVFRGAHPQCIEPQQQQQMFWMWFLTGWSVVLAVLIRKAFLAEEIEPVSPLLDYGAGHHQLFLLQSVHAGLGGGQPGALTTPEIETKRASGEV
uniref:Transmembrane protein n=1 Tax=Noctiluca scintillans TaxID=2966 RepID=A0A7S1AJJ0_NOCSC